MPRMLVYAGPSAHSSVIGGVQHGDALDVLGISAGWYLVRLTSAGSALSRIEGDQGWIPEEVVTVPRGVIPVLRGGTEGQANVDGKPPTMPTPTTAPLTVTVIAPEANVRSGPEVGDNIIGQVYQGEDLIVLERTDGWYLVQLGAQRSDDSNIRGGQGWVRSTVVTPP